MKYSRILTFFFVSDVVSSEVKSRLGAVIRWLKRSMYRKCTRPGNSSRYLLMVREALVIIIKDNTICTRKQAKKAVSLHNYNIPLHCASHSLIWIPWDTSFLQQLHFWVWIVLIHVRETALHYKRNCLCVFTTLVYWVIASYCFGISIFEEMAMEGHQMANVGRDQNHGSYKKITDWWKEGIWRKVTGFKKKVWNMTAGSVWKGH